MVKLTVYKCEYCGEESQSRSYMEAHEKHCKELHDADLQMYSGMYPGEEDEDFIDGEDEINDLPFYARGNDEGLGWTFPGSRPTKPTGQYPDIRRTHDLAKFLESPEGATEEQKKKLKDLLGESGESGEDL